MCIHSIALLDSLFLHIFEILHNIKFKYYFCWWFLLKGLDSKERKWDPGEKLKNYLALIFTTLHNLISTNLLKFMSPASSQLFLLIITSPGPSPSAFFFLAVFSLLLMLFSVGQPFRHKSTWTSPPRRGALLKLFRVRNTIEQLKQRPSFSSSLDSSFTVVQCFWHSRKGWFLLCL